MAINLIGHLLRCGALAVSRWSQNRSREREAGNGCGFRARMMGISRANGLELRRLDDQGATFDLGRGYVACLVQRGDKVGITVGSAVTFPPGRAPREFVKALPRLNLEMPHLIFDVADGPAFSAFCVSAEFGTAVLTPSGFMAALDEMVPRMVTFD